MSAQLALPFVSIVGASPSAQPEACLEVSKPKRRITRKKSVPVTDRGAEAPPVSTRDDDYSGLDIHDYLVRSGDACFIFPVRGDDMAEAEIFDGDMLVVDKHLQPAHGHIVVAYVEGERLVRRLHHQGKKTSLQTGNPLDPELVLEHGSELTIWGVVVGKFKRFQP